MQKYFEFLKQVNFMVYVYLIIAIIIISITISYYKPTFIYFSGAIPIILVFTTGLYACFVWEFKDYKKRNP